MSKDISIFSSVGYTDYDLNDARLGSPIERFLFERINKFKNSGVDVILQYEVITIDSTFYVDLVLAIGSKKIGIECDGKDFHEGEENEIYDEWRDALILETGKIDTIFRFRGKDIHFFTDEIIFILARQLPDFFDYTLIFKYPTLFKKYFYNYHKSREDKRCIEFSENKSAIIYYKRDLRENQSYYASRGLLIAARYSGMSHKNLSQKDFRDKALDIREIIWHLNENNHEMFLRILPYIKFTDLNFEERTIELVKFNRTKIGLSNHFFKLGDKVLEIQGLSKVDFHSKNKTIWNNLLKDLFGNFIPEKSVWNEFEHIYKILRTILAHTSHIICYLPNGGSLEITSVYKGFEPFFLEFITSVNSSTPILINPLQLEFARIHNDETLGYFILNSKKIERIDYGDKFDDSLMQKLVEIKPGIYDNAEEYYKNSSDNMSQAGRIVSRFYEGYINIMPKSSSLNKV